MSHDVEMNEVTSPLLDNGVIKVNNGITIPDVEIKSSKAINEKASEEPFTGLSKEELEKIANDPFWKRLRLILFILFWLIWAGMLVAAIIIVVLSPKCPKRPQLDFWEKKTGYWVDAAAFVDSDGNNVGDFDGLNSKLDYIQKLIGAGYIVLDPIFAGQYSNVFGSVNSFREIDMVVGNETTFKKFIKDTRKRGIEVVLVVDFNSLHKSSVFLKSNLNAAKKNDDVMRQWVARDGKNTQRTFKDQAVYSSTSQMSKMIDLDLKNESVLSEIRESVKKWLGMGVRGFLLTNIAFYVENTTFHTQSTFTDNLNVSKWYKNQTMSGQVFTADTKYFLKEIRKVMNEVAKKTDKSRVLIVEAGNVGFGLTEPSVADPMLQYIDPSDKIADMIVGREFLRNRGWNLDVNQYSKSSVNNYLAMTTKDQRKFVALTSATSTSLRTTDLIKLAAPFLIPGNPLIYFGTEIGTECNISDIKSVSVEFYPQNLKFPLEDIEKELPTKCNHMIMPWDNSGLGFYNGHRNSTDNYINSAKMSVQSLTAIGMDETIFQLHQRLIKIREEPSLQWGEINMLPRPNTKDGHYEIFVREASGFPKIIVALIRDIVKGKVFSFSSICEKVLPILIYPSNANLPENKEVASNNIFLKIDGKESLHVFKCVM